MAGDDYYACAFADPPDNIGLEYDGFDDNMSKREYHFFLRDLVEGLTKVAGVTWISYNSKWADMMGWIIYDFTINNPEIEKKHCVQTFTFGQNNKRDLGNGHRPVWRLRWPDAPLYPDQIKVESWRQKNGDPRAAEGGRVPLDVFDFPRVVGNSKQRRKWHKTQLHEGLVERCIKLSTREGDRVLDPFAGTGTVLRVCRRINRWSTSFEISPNYCLHIAAENEMGITNADSPSSFLRCRSCRGRIMKMASGDYVSCEHGCGKIIPLQDQTPTYVLSSPFDAQSVVSNPLP
jgi:hypothetical protein